MINLNDHLAFQIVGFSREAVLIPPELRYRHIYIIGATRTGKSTLIERMALEDMKKGKGVVLIDPAGDLALSLVNEHSIYFSKETPLTYNPLSGDNVVDDFLEVLNKVIVSETSTGMTSARMNRILRQAVRLALFDDFPSILTLQRILSYNVGWRRKLAERAKDSEIYDFWKAKGEYEKSYRDYSMSADAILDRLDSFVSDPLIREITCGETRIDFREIVDTQKSFIVNLAGFSMTKKHFLGNIFIHGIKRAIIDRPKEARKPLAIYVDEFQNYITPDFEEILSQGAKFKAGLCLAHQTHDQIPPSLLGSVLGNASTLIVFRCGGNEAWKMSGHFLGVQKDNIIGLQDHFAYIRIVTDEYLSETLPPPKRKKFEIKPVVKEIAYEEEAHIGWCKS